MSPTSRNSSRCRIPPPLFVFTSCVYLAPPLETIKIITIRSVITISKRRKYVVKNSELSSFSFIYSLPSVDKLHHLSHFISISADCTRLNCGNKYSCTSVFFFFSFFFRIFPNFFFRKNSNEISEK